MPKLSRRERSTRSYDRSRLKEDIRLRKERKLAKKEARINEQLRLEFARND